MYNMYMLTKLLQIRTVTYIKLNFTLSSPVSITYSVRTYYVVSITLFSEIQPFTSI